EAVALAVAVGPGLLAGEPADDEQLPRGSLVEHGPRVALLGEARERAQSGAVEVGRPVGSERTQLVRRHPVRTKSIEEHLQRAQGHSDPPPCGVQYQDGTTVRRASSNE